MRKYKYGVIYKGGTVVLSYHETVAEALERIDLYETIDEREGVQNEYDWKALED